jgi:hypothetical protein
LEARVPEARGIVMGQLAPVTVDDFAGASGVDQELLLVRLG